MLDDFNFYFGANFYIPWLSCLYIKKKYFFYVYRFVCFFQLTRISLSYSFFECSHARPPPSFVKRLVSSTVFLLLLWINLELNFFFFFLSFPPVFNLLSAMSAWINKFSPVINGFFVPMVIEFRFDSSMLSIYFAFYLHDRFFYFSSCKLEPFVSFSLLYCCFWRYSFVSAFSLCSERFIWKQKHLVS